MSDATAPNIICWEFIIKPRTGESQDGLEDYARQVITEKCYTPALEYYDLAPMTFRQLLKPDADTPPGALRYLGTALIIGKKPNVQPQIPTRPTRKQQRQKFADTRGALLTSLHREIQEGGDGAIGILEEELE